MSHSIPSCSICDSPSRLLRNCINCRQMCCVICVESHKSNKICHLITMYVDNLSNVCKHSNGQKCTGYCLICSKQICANCQDKHADHSESLVSMKSAMKPIKNRLQTCRNLYRKKTTDEKNLIFSLTEEITKLKKVEMEIKGERITWKQLIDNIKDTFLQRITNHMAKLEEICDQGDKKQACSKNMMNTIDSLKNVNSVGTFYPIWFAVLEELESIEDVDKIPECGTFSLVLQTLPDLSYHLVENRVNAVETEEMYKSVRVLCESILRQFSKESVEETEALNNLTTIPLLFEYVQSKTSINQKTMLDEHARLRYKARDLEKKKFDLKELLKEQKDMFEERANVQNEQFETQINELKISHTSLSEEKDNLEEKLRKMNSEREDEAHALGNLKKVLRENEDGQKKVEHLEKQIQEMKTADGNLSEEKETELGKIKRDNEEKQTTWLNERAYLLNKVKKLEEQIHEIQVIPKTILEQRVHVQTKVEELQKEINEIKSSYENLSDEKEKIEVELRRIKSEQKDKGPLMKDKTDVWNSLNVLHEAVVQMLTDEDRENTVPNIENVSKSPQAVVEFVLNHICKMNQKLITLKSDLNDEIAKQTDLTKEEAAALETAKNNTTIFNKELESTKEQLEQFRNDNFSLNQQIKDSEEQFLRVKKENDQTTAHFKVLSKEKDALNSRIESMKQKITAKENEVGRLSTEVKNMSSSINEKENQMVKIQQDRDKSVYLTNQLSSQLDQMKRFIAQQKEIIHKQEDALIAFKKEKDDLQTRLSSVAGEKLTKGNPSITDLGDPNRPMKISEKYGELYDNEWTDALDNNQAVKEYYHGLNGSEIEEIVICHLHRLLKCCYKDCLAKADEQMQALGKAFAETMYLTFNSEEEVLSLPVCKEASVFRRAKSVEFAKVLFENKILCGNVMDDWNYNYKNEKVMQLLMTSSFFEKCVYICWSMVIQDPVMYLDEDVPADTPIDKNTYKEFIKSGNTVAFVVWPALFLHKDGPLLYKGVVQAYWK